MILAYSDAVIESADVRNATYLDLLFDKALKLVVFQWLNSAQAALCTDNGLNSVRSFVSSYN
jgi:hypothetical protein